MFSITCSRLSIRVQFTTILGYFFSIIYQNPFERFNLEFATLSSFLIGCFKFVRTMLRSFAVYIRLKKVGNIYRIMKRFHGK